MREENKIAGEGGGEVREDDGDGEKNMPVAGKGKPNQLITDPSTWRRRWGGNKKLRTHCGTKREKWRENIG